MDDDHEPAPLPGTAYSVGATPNSGRPADLNRPFDYPVEAHCTGCGMIIRLDEFIARSEGSDWVHTGRAPGDPG